METSDKLKLGRIPQNTWTEVSKKDKVMKDKERVRNCAKLKKTKERELKYLKGHYDN